MAALQLVTEGNWAKIPHINPFTRKAYERNKVGYIFGLAGNPVLTRLAMAMSPAP